MRLNEQEFNEAIEYLEEGIFSKIGEKIKNIFRGKKVATSKVSKVNNTNGNSPKADINGKRYVLMKKDDHIKLTLAENMVSLINSSEYLGSKINKDFKVEFLLTNESTGYAVLYYASKSVCFQFLDGTSMSLIDFPANEFKNIIRMSPAPIKSSIVNFTFVDGKYLEIKNYNI